MSAQIPDTPTTRQVGEVLGMVFTVCAARVDATEDQLLELRDRVIPELRLFTVTRDDTRIRARIAEVLGASWRPSGQWAEAIANPLGASARELTKLGADASSLFG